MIGLLLVAARILLRDGHEIRTDIPPKVSKHEFTWYYVNFASRNQMKSVISKMSLDKMDIYPVDESTISIALPRGTASKISKLSGVWIHKIPSSHKPISNSTRYIVFSSEKCELPGTILSSFGQYSIIDFKGSPQLLAKTPCVRSYQSFSSPPRFLARYNRLLTHYFPTDFETAMSTSFYGIDTLHSRGFNGKDQCIAIVDSGIDVKTPWFTDPRGDFLVNTSSLKHRKVKALLPFGDTVDDEDGHGTFLAGIIAGKPLCKQLGSAYDGIASEAKIFMVDVKKRNESHFVFPEHFADIVEVPSFFDCSIQLNAWAVDDTPLLTQAIDSIAYRNPTVLLIFPADVDNSTSKIRSPADAKNVLTVGAVTSSQSSLLSPDVPIMVRPLKHPKVTLIGYTDRSGVPLIDFSAEARKIGFCKSCACVISENSSYENCSIAFAFGEQEAPILEIPIIRLPETSRPYFEDDSVSVLPSFLFSDDSTRPYQYVGRSASGSSRIFKIKPEVAAPSGPIFGPKSGVYNCTQNCLTAKEGVSISSAIIAADAVLIRQYLQGLPYFSKRKPKGTLIKAILVNSARDLANGKSPTPSTEYGWGIPILENVLPIGTSYPNITFLQDISIQEGQMKTFCFTASAPGIVRATISWLDIPRDPLSLVDVSSQISLRIMTDDHYSLSALANNRETDLPIIDIFNTIGHAEKVVTADSQVKVIVVGGRFALSTPVNFSLVISGPVLVSSLNNLSCPSEPSSIPCARDCIFRGTCVNGFCVCQNDRTGDFCGTKLEKMNERTPWRGTIRRFEWLIFKFAPRVWKKGRRVVIPTVGLNRSQFGVHISVGRYPSWDHTLCTLDNCPGGFFTNSSLILDYDSWDFVDSKTPFMIGVFSKSDDQTQLEFEIYSEDSKEE